MSKKKLKTPGNKSREPETVVLVISEFIQADSNISVVWVSGTLLEELFQNSDEEWFINQLLECLADGEVVEPVRDRGIWVWVGWPAMSGSDTATVIDFSDGELRRPTEKELNNFALGPPEPEAEPEDAAPAVEGQENS